MSNSSPSQQLTTKQKRSQFALRRAAGIPIETAAAELQVPASTAYGWDRRPDVARERNEYLNTLYQDGGAQLIAGMKDAISCLRNLIESGSNTVKLRAAKGLIELALRFKQEADVEMRLQEVERLASGVESGSSSFAAAAIEMVRSTGDLFHPVPAEPDSPEPFVTMDIEP